MQKQTIRSTTEGGLARAITIHECQGWKKLGKPYQDKDHELAWGDTSFCQDMKKND